MFKVSVFTIEGPLYSGLAREVCLPTEEEQLSILDFHQPMMARLTKGEVTIDQKKSIAILDGIAHFDHHVLNLVVGLA